MSPTDADGSARLPTMGKNPSGSDGDPTSSYYGTNAGSAPSGSTDSAGTNLPRGAVTNRTPPPRPAGQGGPRPAGAAGAAGAATGGSGPRPAAKKGAAAPRRRTKGPRRVRLAVARVDPWSVMKMSFLLSVAAGIAGVILTAVLWMILSTMNVFTDIEGVLQSLQTTQADPFSIKDYVGFGRITSLSIVLGVINVILLTAIATVMAFLYNICSALVGGVQLTLTDD